LGGRRGSQLELAFVKEENSDGAKFLKEQVGTGGEKEKKRGEGGGETRKAKPVTIFPRFNQRPRTNPARYGISCAKGKGGNIGGIEAGRRKWWASKLDRGFTLYFAVDSK